MQLEVYSDAICPWCFIGKRRLDAALTPELADGIDVAWRAYQLYPQIALEGMDRDLFMELRFGGKERVRSSYTQIEQEGESAGIRFNFRGIKRMPNTRNAHRLTSFAEAAGLQTALCVREGAGQRASSHRVIRTFDDLALQAPSPTNL